MKQNTEKLLSICIPTYNRGFCIKEQLEQLKQMPLESFNKIEIIISDNCSNDNTEEVVNQSMNTILGKSLIYIRNKENIGPNWNFVQLFKSAKGKYVWLLGDDDIIIHEELDKLIKFLDNTGEFGVLHLYFLKKDIDNDYKITDDSSYFISKVSRQFTYISGNIVNARFIPFIEFEKYVDTWFPYMPLYITALLKSNNNILYTRKILDRDKDASRNGGYNFFEVFVQNYLNIWMEYVDEGLISIKTYNFLKRDILPYIYSFIKDLLIIKKSSNRKADNGWKIIFKYYGKEWYFYTDLVKWIIRSVKNRAVRE